MTTAPLNSLANVIGNLQKLLAFQLILDKRINPPGKMPKECYVLDVFPGANDQM